jgi:hypothetical protein
MLLPEVLHIRSAGFEDAQPEQAQHGNQGEVEAVGRLAGRGEQGLELQMRQPERWGLGRDRWAPQPLGRGVLEDAVDDAGPVEAADDGGAPRHRRRLEPADLLAPAHVQLQLCPLCCERVQAALGAPAEEHP